MMVQCKHTSHPAVQPQFLHFDWKKGSVTSSVSAVIGSEIDEISKEYTNQLKMLDVLGSEQNSSGFSRTSTSLNCDFKILSSMVEFPQIAAWGKSFDLRRTQMLISVSILKTHTCSAYLSSETNFFLRPQHIDHDFRHSANRKYCGKV